MFYLLRAGEVVAGIPRIPTMDDVPLNNSRVLVRIDINSPVNPETGEILDDTRIKAHVPTVKELAERGNAVVLASHQGRPGTPDFVSLEAHARLLEKHLGIPVAFIDDVIGPAARNAIKELGKGEVLLLENTRLISEETIEALPESQARTFMVRKLAPLFDYYVNDAFATAHRSQPTIVGFPLVLPSAAGRLMEKEVKALSRAFDPEETPKVFVLGGGKVHDTIRIIEYLSRKRIAERILTTGLVAELFLVAKGVDLGQRNMVFLEKKGILSLVPRARRVLLQGAPIETPVDFVVLLNNGETAEQPSYNVSGLIRDIGSSTLKIYGELMREARIIVLRGPAGVMEDPRFRRGTRELVKLALGSGAYTIIGGGHLTAVVSELGMLGNAGHLSTGGGALLLFLAGEPLPALEALVTSAQRFLGWHQ